MSYGTEIGPYGISLGGAWMTQTIEYDAGSPVSDIVDGYTEGPSIGGFLWLRTLPWLSVSFEALYIRKGFAWTAEARDINNAPLGTITEEFNANYISLPVSAVYEHRWGRWGVSAFGGLSLEVLLSHDDVFVFNDAKPLTLGALFGGGLEWNRLGLSVRYVTDLTNAYDKPSTSFVDSVKNHGVMVLLTVAAHSTP